MSNKSAAPASSAEGRRPRRAWTLGADDPEAVLRNARNAFFVMLGVIALLWIIQIANWADGYHLTLDYGIKARDVAAMPYILTAPFLHVSWTHIESNSGPLFIFGFLAAYRGIGKWAAVTVIVVLTSGFAAWFFEPTGDIGVGASGVVFGYFGYIMVRGLFDRHIVDVLIGAVMALCFAYQFSVLLPHQGIGWQAHIGGVVGGIACGWLLRDRSPRSATASARTRAVTASGGTVPLKAGQGSAGAATGALPATNKSAPPAKTGKNFAVDPSNPRADLYKQLDDMGL